MTPLGDPHAPRKEVKKEVCPSCGEEGKETYKTWEIIAPFPDKKMRITVTIHDMLKFPSCGKSFREVVSKVKLVRLGLTQGCSVPLLL